MRKILFIIGAFLLLLSCTEKNKSRDFVKITISDWNQDINDRNGKDYVRLWVNDTLQFSDTFHVDYVDSIEETWPKIRMNASVIHKANRDSIKIRIRLITLDSVLFAGQHAVDTTFFYRIDNIQRMNIDYYRQINYFRLWDPVNNPMAFLFD